MQRKTKKKFDVIKISINLVLLILMILSITKKENVYYAWYWVMVSVMLVYEVYYSYKWINVDEWNIDKHKSKAIRYSYDGLTTGTIILSGAIYLIVMGFEAFQNSIKTNIYIIVMVYALFTISILCNYLAVNSANRDTKKLAEKTFKYKK
ncbi:MAG: hypothetical protein J6B89_01955 [Bacilli bacterium]|nr:hypothetical protein [Bacilli bacterium]